MSPRRKAALLDAAATEIERCAARIRRLATADAREAALGLGFDAALDEKAEALRMRAASHRRRAKRIALGARVEIVDASVAPGQRGRSTVAALTRVRGRWLTVGERRFDRARGWENGDRAWVQLHADDLARIHRCFGTGPQP